MALTYSLKYKKLNHFQRTILEKEGEIIIDRQTFRLKGKGGQDHGENIYFSDIKNILIKDDHLIFTMFTKERYILSDFFNLFDSFLKDFLRVRNEFLAENLFMKIGMLYQEFEGAVEIINNFGKNINKGKARIQFYEGSIVIIPEACECFAIYPDFLKNHEFDEDEYVLRLYLENGNIIHISKFGTSFEDAQEVMESLLGKVYERVVNSLLEFLPDFDAGTLLKLAYKVKNGRLVPFNSLKKIHDEMPSKLEALAFSKNTDMQNKALYLRKSGSDEHFYLSFAFHRNDQREIVSKAWFLYAFPDKNLLVLGKCDAGENTMHFFRIIAQQGDPKEKILSKILEIDHLMVLFHGDLSPLYKERRDLRKTKYKTAVKKLSFLRLLRKSYLGKSTTTDMDQFKQDVEKFSAKALIFETQIIKPTRYLLPAE